jgi:hypothetical protein
MNNDMPQFGANYKSVSQLTFCSVVLNNPVLPMFTSCFEHNRKGKRDRKKKGLYKDEVDPFSIDLRSL